MRNERKFTAEASAAEFAETWLDHVCVRDPEFPSGRISSIYFDNPSLSSYQEKANGDYIKTKVRLRWYQPSLKNEKGEILSFLEIKMKEGTRGRKARKTLHFQPGWLDQVPLEDDVLARMIYENVYELGEEIPSGLFSVISIVYNRARFICPFSGARVSLDTAIHTDRVNRELLPFAGPSEIETIVLEIKDETMAEIPWLEGLFNAGFRYQSFSKYGSCMSKLVHGI